MMRDPELAAVSSRGLAQPVTGTEDCVCPRGKQQWEAGAEAMKHESGE